MKHFVLPCGLSIEKLLAHHPPKKKLNPDVLKYIVSAIMYQIENSDNDEKKNGYCPLSAELLKGINYNYRAHVSYLIHCKVIEVRKNKAGKESYQAGVCCKEYRIKAVYNDVTIEKVVSQRILKAAEASRPVPEYIERWFNSGLTIDEGMADAVIATIKPKKKQGRHRISLRKIQALAFNLSRDNWGNRVYTPLTSLKRELKPCLRYNGQPLVSLDLKSSQPFLIATCLLNPHFYENEKETNVENFSSSDQHSIPSLPIPTTIDTYSKTVTIYNQKHNREENKMYITLQNISSQYIDSIHATRSTSPPLCYVTGFYKEVKEYIVNEDVQRFIHIVLKGDIYNHLVEKFPTLSTREKEKICFGNYFIQKADHTKNSKLCCHQNFLQYSRFWI